MRVSEKKKGPPEESKVEPKRSPAVMIRQIVVQGRKKRKHIINKKQYMDWPLKDDRHEMNERLKIVGIRDRYYSPKGRRLTKQ